MVSRSMPDALKCMKIKACRRDSGGITGREDVGVREAGGKNGTCGMGNMYLMMENKTVRNDIPPQFHMSSLRQDTFCFVPHFPSISLLLPAGCFLSLFILSVIPRMHCQVSTQYVCWIPFCPTHIFVFRLEHAGLNAAVISNDMQITVRSQTEAAWVQKVHVTDSATLLLSDWVPHSCHRSLFTSAGGTITWWCWENGRCAYSSPGRWER